MRIEGNAALITGAASGMGEATARLLANQGAKISLLDVNEAKINELAAQINASAIACDVTSSESMEQSVALAAEKKRCCQNFGELRGNCTSEKNCWA